MRKNIATLAHKYTPEYGERTLESWKPRSNFWFLPFSLICLFIHFNFTYQQKLDEERKKSNDQQDDQEEDATQGLLNLLPGNFNEKTSFKRMK